MVGEIGAFDVSIREWIDCKQNQADQTPLIERTILRQEQDMVPTQFEVGWLSAALAGILLIVTIVNRTGIPTMLMALAILALGVERLVPINARQVISYVAGFLTICACIFIARDIHGRTKR